MNIFATRIEPLAKSIDDILPVLDAARQNKIKAQKQEVSKLHTLYSGLLLRYALLSCASQDFQNQITINYGDNGKPYLADVDNLHFSISHSKDYVLVAIDDKPIGIDIQFQNSYKNNIANRFFTTNEASFLDSISDEKIKSANFYKLWCLKEACSKINGEGIVGGAGRYTFINQTLAYDNVLKSNVYVQEYSQFKDYSCICASRDNSSFPNLITDIKASYLY